MAAPKAAVDCRKWRRVGAKVMGLSRRYFLLPKICIAAPDLSLQKDRLGHEPEGGFRRRMGKKPGRKRLMSFAKATAAGFAAIRSACSPPLSFWGCLLNLLVPRSAFVAHRGLSFGDNL